uniref:Uncharacterized protein n=1 Tax=Peronospora matthiolae TaxID=2874970 RepID=A0AAV1U208_9STRA
MGNKCRHLSMQLYRSLINSRSLKKLLEGSASSGTSSRRGVFTSHP